MSDIDSDTTLNKRLTHILGELNKLMLRKNELHRARAYGKAQQAIVNYKKDIKSINDIKDLPNIGKTIIEKLNEYIDTGKLEILEKEKTNPVSIALDKFSKIYGVGPAKANDLIKKNIMSIKELKEPKNIKLLNEKQKIGLKYYDDINKKIPRQEIETYKKVINNIFNEIKVEVKGESKFEIVGSYRRGNITSGDIDVIITNSENDCSIYTKLVDKLIKANIIIEVLSRGKVKSLLITRLPTSSSQSVPIARRVDFLYTPPKEYSFAILYFTGSMEFNTVMRQHALNLNYTLNEHGISYIKDGIKQELVTTHRFPDEESIFKFLNLKYKKPTERKDGFAVEIIKPTDKLTSKEDSSDEDSSDEDSSDEDSSDEDSSDEDSSSSSDEDKTPKTMRQPTSKNKTIKKQSRKTINTTIKMNLDNFLKEGQSKLDKLSQAELVEIIDLADDKYYCDNSPIMTDNEYDILREYIIKRYPDNKIAKQGHTKCLIEKNRVKLPYEMWSMDKIKPDTKELKKFTEKYKGPYVLSYKLDGISALYMSGKNSKQSKLYTRGNGREGQDISHLIDTIIWKNKTPQDFKTEFVLRGEIIIEQKVFKEKYSATFANPRNFVAGIVNKKTPDPEILTDIDFVAYEVISPNLKPSSQMEFIEENWITPPVHYKIEKSITNELLSQLLIEWRTQSPYEIDGIICVDDNIYDRQSKNPEHAFAFKMVLSDQVAEAKVVDVLWTASKDGYLKPRVKIEQVTLGGVKIEYATGKNARFIQNNKIGVGSVIRIVRSGDVIPEIQEVIVPADIPLFPTEPYKWNDTNVDIIIEDKKTNITVIQKTITNFFKKLEVEGIGEGNIKKLIVAGYDTISKILAMTQEDFLKIDGFKDKMATKLSTNIKNKVETTSLSNLAAASGIFGRGIAEKRIENILDNVPDILTNKQLDDKQKIKQLQKVDGMALKTSRQFVENIPEFLKFIETANLTNKLYKDTKTESDTQSQTQSQTQTQTQTQIENPLKNKKIVMTGFRDKELETYLKNLNIGIEIQSQVTKKTSIVLVKNLEEDTGKANLARQLKIPLQLPEDFKEQYNINI